MDTLTISPMVSHWGYILNPLSNLGTCLVKIVLKDVLYALLCAALEESLLCSAFASLL